MRQVHITQDLGLFLRKPFTEIFCHFGSVLSNFFFSFPLLTYSSPGKKDAQLLACIISKNPTFLFQEGFFNFLFSRLVSKDNMQTIHF